MPRKSIPLSERPAEEQEHIRRIQRAANQRYRARNPHRWPKHKPRAAMSEEELMRARARDRDYNGKNRAKKRAYNQQYYAGHQEELCQQSAEYYYANKPVIVAKRRERRATPEGKAAERAHHVGYRTANHATVLAKERAYAQSPRGQLARKAGHIRRRARKANAPRNDFTAPQWRALCKASGYRCAYCGTKFPYKELTPDHITPLSRGGSHTLANILPACLDCNMRKHANDVPTPVQPFLLLPPEDAAAD